MQDAWRAYLELALGLTEASKKKAQKAAKKLVGQSGATAAQLQGMAEELLSTGLANREALVKIIRFEVDRALGKVGLATAEEVADLNARVDELQRKLREAQERRSAPGAPPQPPEPDSTPAEPSGSGVSPEPPPTRTVAPATTKAVAKKAVAKKTVAKKTVVKKAVAKKTVAKKTTAGDAPKRVEAKKLPPPPAQKAAKKAARNSAAERSAGDRSTTGEET